MTYTAGTNGTISGSANQTVNSGSAGTAVTATPSSGYHFVNWSDGSTSATRTDSNVLANLSVTATFAANVVAPTTYTLTYTAGANGTLIGSASQTVSSGANGTAVTAVPVAGYKFVSWSDGNTSATRTDADVNADISVTATFTLNAAASFTLTYTAGANGTLTGTASQTVIGGADGSAVTAVPAAGYTFSSWSDGSTANPRKDIDVLNNVTVTASFTPVTASSYTLNYAAGDGGSITGVLTQSVISGASGTSVTAVPNDGYYFVQWIDGNTNATRLDSGITANLTVTAQFAVNVVHSVGGGGGSSGGSSGGTTGTTGGTTTSPSPAPSSVTSTGSVVDKTGKTVQSITIASTTQSDGTTTVSVPAAQAVVMQQPDGTKSTLTDATKLGFTVQAADGSTAATGPVISMSADGTVSVTSLASGSESKVAVTYDLGNGQKIIIGSMDVKVDSTGKVSLTSTLIDPYGVITDSVTGQPIAGANLTLHYANTARNIAAGKTPDSVVALPVIPGFAPNNNQDPQVSNATGTCGFMVYPSSDYYVTAIVPGYDDYKSPTISVEQYIVKLDLRMNKPITGVTRISGESRVDTAIAIAKSSHTGLVSNAILATADNFPDALAGSVLAYKLNAPILLVGDSAEDQAKVLDYLKNNLYAAGTVYILGGTGAVSADMESKVSAEGFASITRLGGLDRYETASKISEALDVKKGTPVVLVYGENYPDALSISGAAADMQYPIFLVNGDSLTDAVAQKITAINPTKVYIIGSQGVVSQAIQDQVTKLTSLDHSNIVRLGGADRFETSLAVAQFFNQAGQTTCIATGNNFPDALAGSAYAANANAPIILTDSTLSDDAIAYLKTRKMTGVTIFGGAGVVSKDIERELSQILAK